MRAATFVLTATIVVLLVSCGGSEDDSLPQGADPVELDPADFTTEIDNPFWPMRAGTRWVYRETGPTAPCSESWSPSPTRRVA